MKYFRTKNCNVKSDGNFLLALIVIFLVVSAMLLILSYVIPSPTFADNLIINSYSSDRVRGQDSNVVKEVLYVWGDGGLIGLSQRQIKFNDYMTLYGDLDISTVFIGLEKSIAPNTYFQLKINKDLYNWRPTAMVERNEGAYHAWVTTEFDNHIYPSIAINIRPQISENVQLNFGVQYDWNVVYVKQGIVYWELPLDDPDREYRLWENIKPQTFSTVLGLCVEF
jgi:hypothetical protein